MLFNQFLTNQFYLCSFSFLLVILLSSCEKVLDKLTLEEVNSHDSYYPINIGYFIVYRVDSTRYVKSSLDSQPIVTETSAFIRELIEETILGFIHRFNIRSRFLAESHFQILGFFSRISLFSNMQFYYSKRK